MRPREIVRRLPGAHRVVSNIVPARRAEAAQWRRLEEAVSTGAVQTGPFAGMVLTRATTGSHIPKRLGCYEAELHELIESWTSYETIIDVGCGEGWYVVGLARRMPGAAVVGFDISRSARAACRAMAKANAVNVTVQSEATPELIDRLIEGRTLLIVDAEGAEVNILNPRSASRMRDVDILVELHEFAAPGVNELIRRRFIDFDVTEIHQSPRDVAGLSALTELTPPDKALAVSEARDPNQSWLWMTPPALA